MYVCVCDLPENLVLYMNHCLAAPRPTPCTPVLSEQQQEFHNKKTLRHQHRTKFHQAPARKEEEEGRGLEPQLSMTLASSVQTQ